MNDERRNSCVWLKMKWHRIEERTRREDQHFSMRPNLTRRHRLLCDSGAVKWKRTAAEWILPLRGNRIRRKICRQIKCIENAQRVSDRDDKIAKARRGRCVFFLFLYFFFFISRRESEATGDTFRTAGGRLHHRHRASDFGRAKQKKRGKSAKHSAPEISCAAHATDGCRVRWQLETIFPIRIT